ncbi:MAG: DUF4838 domain-containing protein [Lentisphaerae bacterium]|nr:DUF4838 domain-containing protein [Lentisphaerota bacterium]
MSVVTGWRGTLLALVVAGVWAPWASGLTLGAGGQPRLAIRTAAAASLPEQTAAAELRDYLGRVIGVAPALEAEAPGQAGPAIYVGPTAFAAAHGLDGAGMGAEEWAIKTVEGSLILAGGRPRGVLYAVYRFLEDEVGVHWWTPWEETVPRSPDLAVGDLDRRGRPVLAYRDIYMLYGRDVGRFAARNRLNREGDARIEARWGGGRDYGPPYHVHTFYLYLPPAQYFKTNPEFFSLVDGRRQAERHQLCLSNPALRDLFAQKLRETIEAAEAKAREAGGPPPAVYSLSQNDWNGQCQCEACQAIVEREGSEAGLMLDFVNDMASRVTPDHPDIHLDTLAYMYTQEPPRQIKAHDRVIVRLCDTHSNATFPITHPANRAFHDFLLSWGAVAKNLRIWDYAVTYAPPLGLPYPSEDTYGEDYRFYAEHNVEGVFTELEYPILADVRDLKVWVMIKQLEDPSRPYAEVAEVFAKGFYGAGGPHVLSARRLLRESQDRRQSTIAMSPGPAAFAFLDLDTVRGSQEAFDRADAAVGDDEVLRRRLRHARLSLDRATYLRQRDLRREWAARGQDAAAFPLDVNAAAARVRTAWSEQVAMRLDGSRAERSRRDLDAELRRFSELPSSVAPPSRFAGRPAGSVIDFTADMTRNWKDIVEVVKDPDAESGMANRLSFPNRGGDKHPLEKYLLPMPWGLYEQATKAFRVSATIKPEDVPGSGYHWYRFGTHAIPASTYLHVFWSWIIQLDLDNALMADSGTVPYTLWARIKFTGPAFPHGRAEDANAIWIERVVLERAEQP